MIIRTHNQAVKHVDDVVALIDKLGATSEQELLLLNGYLMAANNYGDARVASILQNLVIEFADEKSIPTATQTARAL